MVRRWALLVTVVLIASCSIGAAQASARFTTGDWEGIAGGFPASFELSYVPSDAAYPGYAPYGYGNLVLLEPSTCPFERYSYAEETVGAGGSYPVHANGSLGLRSYGIFGGLTGTRTAKLSMRIDSPPCRRTFVWRMHPAHRLAVYDGTWRLRFADRESQTFKVSAGGRLATGFGVPQAVSNCGGPVGGFDLFVPANRVATLTTPHQFAVKLTFLRKIASGQITVPGSSCRPLKMSARLVRRAR